MSRLNRSSFETSLSVLQLHPRTSVHEPQDRLQGLISTVMDNTYTLTKSVKYILSL
jgi:hypothetical protein